MLDNIRYKIGAYYMKKADKQIKNRKFKKAFRNIKRTVCVAPDSDELRQFGYRLLLTSLFYSDFEED